MSISIGGSVSGNSVNIGGNPAMNEEYEQMKERLAQFEAVCQKVPEMLDWYCSRLRQYVSDPVMRDLRSYVDARVLEVDNKARALRALLKESETSK